jgi:hypothetical protein
LLDQILDRLFLTRCNYSRCSYNSAIGGHGGVSDYPAFEIEMFLQRRNC